jgi:hypothetical protein
MNYPKRESFFAHKFVRLLTKSCAAQDIGLNAFALLCVIVHQEDAARYCGPVRFWNEQLMSTLSLSPRALRDAREKAIKFGWLTYFRENDRATGRYFVTVPKQFAALSDSPIEEPCAVSGDVSGEVSGADLHMEVHKEVTSNRTRSEHESAPEPSPPSIPVPDPCPVPLPAQNIFGEMRIPTNLTGQDLDEITRWVDAMRDEPTFFPGSPSLQEKVRRAGILKKDGHSIPDLVSAAIAGSYKMLYPPKGQQNAAASSDWIRALNITRQYPDDWQKRRHEMGDDLFLAMKKTGTSRVVNAHGAELGMLEKLFNENLKEIKSGITASN